MHSSGTQQIHLIRFIQEVGCPFILDGATRHRREYERHIEIPIPVWARTRFVSWTTITGKICGN